MKAQIKKIKLKETNNMARRTITAETKTAVLEAANLQGPKHYEAIAKQFGVSVPTIYNWLRALTPATTETPVETTVA